MTLNERKTDSFIVEQSSRAYVLEGAVRSRATGQETIDIVDWMFRVQESKHLV